MKQLSCTCQRNFKIIWIGNFKGEPTKKDSLGGSPFTLCNYYSYHKLSRARFYSLTKTKSPSYIEAEDEYSDDDSILMKSVFETRESLSNEALAC